MLLTLILIVNDSISAIETSANQQYLLEFNNVSSSQVTVRLRNILNERLRCIADIQKQIVDSFKDTLLGAEITYADPAINAHIAEQLLWAGSIRLFERFGKIPVLHCAGTRSKASFVSCLDMEKVIAEKIGNGKGILWYNPGGSWGSLFGKEHDSRLAVWNMVAKHKIPFVSGPQSIFYRDDAHNAVKEDDEFISKHATNRDLLTFREIDSYKFSKVHYSNYTTVKLCPDMTFMIGPQRPNREAKYDVFILVVTEESPADRGTDGNGLKFYEKICKGIFQRGYTCGIGNWGFGNRDKFEHVERLQNTRSALSGLEMSVEIALSTVSLGQIILTDRLNAALLGFLTGKFVFYADNHHRKLTRILATAFNDKQSCSSNIEDMGVYKVANVDNIVEKISKVIITYKA